MPSLYDGTHKAHDRRPNTQRDRGKGRQRGKETTKMRAYYWKVFRHVLSTAVLTGFLAGNN
jgi:hypothetical protein